MRFDIHHWLNHAWAYPNMNRLKLFKGYINATYVMFHQRFMNSKDLTEN